MIYGLYNLNSFTPSPLAVIENRGENDYQIIYPDGHSESIYPDELKEIEHQIIKTNNLFSRRQLKTDIFVLLPDKTLLFGTRQRVCMMLIEWFYSVENIDNQTRTITTNYIYFLIDKIIETTSAENLSKKFLSFSNFFISNPDSKTSGRRKSPVFKGNSEQTLVSIYKKKVSQENRSIQAKRIRHFKQNKNNKSAFGITYKVVPSNAKKAVSTKNIVFEYVKQIGKK